jgi:hypothetical protein
MKKYVGIWIDYEKAFVVSIVDNQERVACIESNVEGHYRLSGGSRSSMPYGPQDVASERKIGERRRHHLHQYYEKIIREIRDSEKILLSHSGNGRKTLAFRRRLQYAPKGRRIGYLLIET